MRRSRRAIADRAPSGPLASRVRSAVLVALAIPLGLATSGCRGARLAASEPAPAVGAARAQPAAPAPTAVTARVAAFSPCPAPALVPACGPVAAAAACDPCDVPWPVLPLAETRAAYTLTAVPPTPFDSMQGQPETPARGSLALHLARVSDEHVVNAKGGYRIASDGEVQLATLEWVSPCLEADLGCFATSFHVGVSLTAYTLEEPLLDEVRDFIERELLGADEGVSENHSAGGRELSLTTLQGLGDRTDLLGRSPMWKAKVMGKVPLPERRLGGRRLVGSASLGITLPAFGAHTDAASDDVALDVAVAGAWQVADAWRIVGAAYGGVPGGTPLYDRLGIAHRDAIYGLRLGTEWRIAERFAASFDLSLNGPYTESSGLPTDHTAPYFHLGFLWQASDRAFVHLVFGENFGTKVPFDVPPGGEYVNVQKDADFSLSLGVTFAL